MRRVLVDDPEFGEMIAHRAGTSYNPRIDHNFAQVADIFHETEDPEVFKVEQVLLGGVCYNHYTHESIQIHSGSWTPHWGSRLLLFMVFDYPFNQLGVKRLFGMVPEANWTAQVFNMKLGFKPVARIEGVFRHGDACVVMRMDREDCRLLGVKPHGFKLN